MSRAPDLNLDILNRGLQFAAIRIASRSQRFQIARFEPQGQKPFESLLGLYFVFAFKDWGVAAVLPEGVLDQDGPKWSVAKMTLFRTGIYHSQDQDGPQWSILVLFSLMRSIWVHQPYSDPPER